jgi:hypothetical protein
MQWVNLKTKQWGRPNLVYNAKKKPMVPNKNMKWPSKQKIMHLPLGPSRISSMCDVNQKPCQRWYEKRNGHVIYLKWFLEIDLLLFFSFWQTTWQGNVSHHIQERNSYANLKWAEKEHMKTIGTSYVANKNKRQFKKYIMTMIGATNAQLFK